MINNSKKILCKTSRGDYDYNKTVYGDSAFRVGIVQGNTSSNHNLYHYDLRPLRCYNNGTSNLLGLPCGNLKTNYIATKWVTSESSPNTTKLSDVTDASTSGNPAVYKFSTNDKRLGFYSYINPWADVQYCFYNKIYVTSTYKTSSSSSYQAGQRVNITIAADAGLKDEFSIAKSSARAKPLYIKLTGHSTNMYYQPINIDDDNLTVNSVCGGKKMYSGDYYISFDWFLRSPILICMSKKMHDPTKCHFGIWGMMSPKVDSDSSECRWLELCSYDELSVDFMKNINQVNLSTGSYGYSENTNRSPMCHDIIAAEVLNQYEVNSNGLTFPWLIHSYDYSLSDSDFIWIRYLNKPSWYDDEQCYVKPYEG